MRAHTCVIRQGTYRSLGIVSKDEMVREDSGDEG